MGVLTRSLSVASPDSIHRAVPAPLDLSQVQPRSRSRSLLSPVLNRLSFAAWKGRHGSVIVVSDSSERVNLGFSAGNDDKVDRKQDVVTAMRDSKRQTSAARDAVPHNLNKVTSSAAASLLQSLPTQGRRQSAAPLPATASRHDSLSAAPLQLGGYAQRAASFSQSSPNLTTAPRPAYSRGPLDVAEGTEDVEDEDQRGDGPLLYSIHTTPPSPSRPRIISHRPSRSLSPERTPAERQAHHIRTLAQLEESPAIGCTDTLVLEFNAIPFPATARPPPPTRDLPPLPTQVQRTSSVDRRSMVLDRGGENSLALGKNQTRLRPRYHSAHTSPSAPLGSYPSQPRDRWVALPVTPTMPNSRKLQSRASAGYDQQSDAGTKSASQGVGSRDEREQGPEDGKSDALDAEEPLTPEAHHGREGSSSTDPAAGSSPSDNDSSKFTDYSFSSRKHRQSFDLVTGPNVTFIDRVRDRDRDKSWAVPATGGSRNKIYGDKRMSESAIDVMTVVEENERDESSTGVQRHRSSRYSQPIVLPLGGLSSSPGSTAPSVVARRDRRHSTRTPTSAASSPLLDMSTGLPVPRPRNRNLSEVEGRPALALARSLSHSAVLVNSTERGTRGPTLPDLSRASNSHTVVIDGDWSSPAPSRAPTPLLRPAPHQRWNSELSPISPSDVPRGRNNSLLGGGGPDADERRALRTRLVLREPGQPTLTYQLGECIGRGQFGSVYRALDLSSGRVVAVKRIKIVGSETEIQQLSHEIELLKDLVHPQVVRYEGFVLSDHHANIILEYVENGSLLKTLKDFGSELPEGLIASYVVKILDGLAFLHSQSIVHLDLKCANILSTKNGHIKLSDFGVSLNLSAVKNLTSNDPQRVNGTPHWMAPEVIQVDGRVCTRSDIWSLACTIIELVTGAPPYAQLNALSAMFRIVEDAMPPLPERCSPPLADLLKQCFAKDPLARPTALELQSHIWLAKNWDVHKDLRLQDSLPFLKRVNLSRSDSPASLSTPSPLLSDPTFFKHDSLDSTGNRASCDAKPAHRELAFVKSSFSKAVECKLCGEYVRRHALLCELCGLISHKTCAPHAPLPCDIRAQLLGYSRNLPDTLLPSSTSSPPSSAISPTSFKLGEYLPFGRGKKLKITLSVTTPATDYSSRTAPRPIEAPELVVEEALSQHARLGSSTSRLSVDPDPPRPQSQSQLPSPPPTVSTPSKLRRRSQLPAAPRSRSGSNECIIS